MVKLLKSLFACFTVSQPTKRADISKRVVSFFILFDCKIGGQEGTRTLTVLLPADFLTTMTFVTFSVCSLDFTLTVAFALGSRRQVSTPFPFLELGSVLGF